MHLKKDVPLLLYILNTNNFFHKTHNYFIAFAIIFSKALLPSSERWVPSFKR